MNRDVYHSSGDGIRSVVSPSIVTDKVRGANFDHSQSATANSGFSVFVKDRSEPIHKVEKSILVPSRRN